MVEPLEFEAHAAAAQNSDRIAFDRGSFVETYDLAPQSAEQRFVFSALPRAGKIVLHIPIASELEPRESAEGLEFRGDFGRVTYGRATAIDARGRRIEAETELVDGAITIHVEASFLADAMLPLTVDPVVSTFTIDGASNSNDFYSDAAYDPTYHQWLVVYEERNSAADSDVVVKAMTDDGVVFGGFYLDLSTDSWESVHCADNANAHQWLIVATVISGPSQTIQGFEFDSGILGGHQFLVANWLFNPPLFPVVGGDPSIGSGPTRYCVAYARSLSATDWDIEAVMVDTNGGVGPTLNVSTSAATVDTSPAISKSNDHNQWMIAWQRNNGTAGHADIWGRRIRWDGVLTVPAFQITSDTREERSAAVSSPLHGTLRYLVTWQLLADGINHDIVASLLEGTTRLDTMDLYDTEPAAPDQVDPSVDSDGQHFLVSWSDGAGAYFDMLATDLHVMGNTLGIAQADLVLDFPVGTDDNSRVVSAASSGATDPSLKHRFLMTWNSGLPGGFADIDGALIDTTDGGWTVPFCFGDGLILPGHSDCVCFNGSPGHGCANSVNAAGALLATSGAPATGSLDSLVLNVTLVPATSPCTFFQETPSSVFTVFGDGLLCSGGGTLRLRTVTAAGGAASFPGPGDPSLSTLGGVPPAGALRAYQVVYRNAANYCTSSTFNTSNGMKVYWAP